jgi:ribosome-associated protein
VDLADVIVHVMLPRTREFYDIEKLWAISRPGGAAARR